MKKIISLLLTIFVLATCLTCPVAFAAEDVIGELEIEYVSRRNYTVSVDITANTGRDYTFVAASYGEGNTLVGAERVDVAAPAQGTETTISADFDLSAKAYVKDTKYTKFLLWDMDTYEPLATAVTENYETVEVAKGKKTGGATTTTGVAYTLEHLPTSRLTDDVEVVDGAATDAHNLGAGFYYTANTGVMYVDLGQPYKIDHIEVVSYMPASYLRASNYNIIVTNTLPDLTAFNAENAGNDVLVAHVGIMEDAINSVSGKKTYYVPYGTEAKQYVSFEKLGNNTDGLVIQEVRVYVLEEDMPTTPMETNVALGKIGGILVNNEVSSISAGVSAVTNGFKSVTDGKYLCTNLGQIYYLDLGAEYDISSVYVDCQYVGCTDELNIYASSDAPANGGMPASKTVVFAATAEPWSTVDRTIELAEAVRARYIYIHRGSANATYGHFRLGELEVWGVPAPVAATNVALGKIGTANAANNATSYPYSAVTDGSVCVGGNSQQFIGGSNGGIFSLDLGAVYNIEKIMLDCVTKDYSSNTSVYISNEPITEATFDSITKTTLLEGTSTSWDTATKTVNVSPVVSGRYIAVRRVGTGNQLRIGELEVWGVPAQ